MVTSEVYTNHILLNLLWSKILRRAQLPWAPITILADREDLNAHFDTNRTELGLTNTLAQFQPDPRLRPMLIAVMTHEAGHYANFLARPQSTSLTRLEQSIQSENVLHQKIYGFTPAASWWNEVRLIQRHVPSWAIDLLYLARHPLSATRLIGVHWWQRLSAFLTLASTRQEEFGADRFVLAQDPTLGFALVQFHALVRLYEEDQEVGWRNWRLGPRILLKTLLSGLVSTHPSEHSRLRAVQSEVRKSGVKIRRQKVEAAAREALTLCQVIEARATLTLAKTIFQRHHIADLSDSQLGNLQVRTACWGEIQGNQKVHQLSPSVEQFTWQPPGELEIILVDQRDLELDPNRSTVSWFILNQPESDQTVSQANSEDLIDGAHLVAELLALKLQGEITKLKSQLSEKDRAFAHLQIEDPTSNGPTL